MRRGVSQTKILVAVVLLTGIALAIVLLMPQEGGAPPGDGTKVGDAGEQPRNTERFVPPPEGAVEELMPVTPPPVQRGRVVRGMALPPPRETRRGIVLDAGATPMIADYSATMVNVSFNQLPFEEACAALSTASKYRVELNASSPRPESGLPSASLNLQNVPFMEALLQLQDQTGAASMLSAENVAENRISLTFSQARAAGRWCVAGPFALVATNITRRTNTESVVANSYCRLTVEVLSEPTYAVNSVGRPEIKAFVDDTGAALAAIEMNLPDQPRTFSFYFRTAANSKRIGTLRGMNLLRLTGAMQRVQADSLTERTTHDLRGFRVEVLPIGTELAVKVRFKRAEMSAEKWNELLPRFEENVVTVFDTANSVMPRVLGVAGKPVVVAEGADTVVITYPIREPLRGRGSVPTRLTMLVPGEVREVHVPFEFKDLILP